LTEQNIAKLFAAAMVPGILAMLGYIVVVALTVHFKPDLAPATAKTTGREKWAALGGVWPIALVFVVVFGGIYGGVFSPTEGAAVGAAMTVLAGLVTRELNADGLKNAVLSTADTPAMVFMIFLGADMMNATLALT
jgi:TRAP-type C4-dicarboxylate transport system permease large subunit